MADIKLLSGFARGSEKSCDSVEGCEPLQKKFVGEKTIFIYVRKDGDDECGDGSKKCPFRTVAHAVRQIPSVIPAGYVYRVDCTGIGLEQLPTEYIFPAFVGAEGIGDFDFEQEFFHYYTSVNIQADPKKADLETGPNVIDAGVDAADPNTGLLEITVLGAGWTPGDLVGKFAIGAGDPTEHSVIWKNTDDTIFLTRTLVPTYPIRIMEPSAQLQADKEPAGFGPNEGIHSAAVNALNTQMAFLGLKINATDAPIDPVAPDFANYGFQVAGTTPSVSLQLCDIKQIGILADSRVRCRQCYFPELLFGSSPLLFTECFVDKSANIGGLPPGAGATVWAGRGGDNLFRKTVLVGTAPLHFRDVFDFFASVPVGVLEMENVQILDTTPELPPGPDFVNDGILWNGGIAYLRNVNISRTAPSPFVPPFPPGSAIKVAGNGASMRLEHVTGSGYDAFGVDVQDGGNVQVADALSGATDITGAGGDTNVGSLGVTTWGAIAVYPASNLADYTAAAATGARLWRTS